MATIGAAGERLHAHAPAAECRSAFPGADLSGEAPMRTAMTRDDLAGTRAFFEKREPRFTGG